jgi:Na+-driven multidrug efflux pump
MNIKLSDHFGYGRLLRFTVPSMVMLLFVSVYSVVDGLFISNFVGITPFAAINLIFPFTMILAAFGFMFGTGGTALVSAKLGERKPEEANRIFSMLLCVSLVLGVGIAVLALVFLRPISLLLGAKGALLDNCVLYGRIIMCAMPFAVLQYLFQNFCVAAEQPKLGLFVILAAGFTNMILDVVLVILLPQAYKLAGAAVATALSQTVGGGIPLIYFFRKNPSFLRLGKTSFNGRIIWKACVNGSSEFMSNVAMNLVGMLYNIQLLHCAGDDGVAAYGVMMYVSMIFAGVFFGYVIGTAPVISYHHGAGNHAEKRSVLRKSLVVISITSLVMLGAAQLLARPLSGIFVSYSPALMELTVRGMRVYAFSFLLMGFAIFVSSFFTALNDGVTSAIVSFLRTLVFQLGAVLLLPAIWGVDGIWVSVVAAELIAVVFSFLFLLLKRRKFQY